RLFKDERMHHVRLDAERTRGNQSHEVHRRSLHAGAKGYQADENAEHMGADAARNEVGKAVRNIAALGSASGIGRKGGTVSLLTNNGLRRSCRGVHMVIAR